MKKTVLVVLMMVVPFCALAVDGQVLINQSLLAAAGGTYTITVAGSYKLSGNLQAKDQNTTVIVIAHDHVTIDLNGFAITGTAACSAGSPCANTGTGEGIATLCCFNYNNITIRNGTIQGMGGGGIALTGDSALVEYMHIRSNGLNGINVAAGDCQIVQHNNVDLNGGYGIRIGGGTVSDNVSSTNNSDGIFLAAGLCANNTSISNSGIGLHCFGGYRGNVMSYNGTDVSGGVNLGQNLCGNAACPGAVF